MSFPPGFEEMCAGLKMEYVNLALPTARLPCKTKPCTVFCLEGTRDCDEWVSYSHAANQALGIAAWGIKQLIEEPGCLEMNNLSKVPPSSRRELGRLAYDAHLFTMPKGANLKALWKDWHEDQEYPQGSFARLDLQEYANKYVDTAMKLDDILRERAIGRKHVAGCPCKTVETSNRFEYYHAKFIAECQQMMNVLEAKPGTLSRDDMVEYARHRYNVMRLMKPFMDDDTLVRNWEYGHEIKDFSPSGLKAGSDHLRKEIKEDRTMLTGPSIVLLGGEDRFRCPYIHEEWNGVHQPTTGA